MPRGSQRPKIVLTTLQRLSETQHLEKWARFKTMHGKNYATKAAEQAAYLIFRANRVRIIYLNDRYGAGYVIWASTAPHTDIDPKVFAQQRLNHRLPSPSRSLLEVETETDAPGPMEMQPVPEDQSIEWQEFKALAESVQDDEHAFTSLAEMHSKSKSFTQGAKACKVYGRDGLCRLQYTCRTKMELVAPECPSNNHCCLADKDDLPDSDNHYTDGPVSPKVIGPGGAKVGGTLSVDIRSIMQPVRDQGQCGSCWAHAAGAVMEGATTKAGLTAVPLSTQFLIDCDRDGQLQCSGGFPDKAFTFAETVTPATEAEYPYEAKPNPSCKLTSGKGTSSAVVASSGFAVRCAATADNLACDNPNESQLLDALKQYGPIAVTVDASNWQSYDGGIFPSYACKHDWMSGDHAVVIVGYGSEDGKNFWLIRNSWTDQWGEEGHIRIEANVGNACGAANYATYATMKAAPAADATQ